MRVLALVLALLAAPLHAQTLEVQEEPMHEAVAPTTAAMQAWLKGFRLRAIAQGVPEATLDAVLPGLEYLPDVVERDRNQAEFTRAIWDYLDRAVSADRVALGVKAARDTKALLDRIEAAYGVDRRVLLAIWGLETSYGVDLGNVPVLSAAATLAYDTRRRAFYEGQLVAGLKIVALGEVAPDRMLGSWAGAMGHTQFMPTSYLDLAVDFTGDGRRDIWGDDPADALASAAAYLAANGWQSGGIWGLEVRLPAGFDHGISGERAVKPVAEWAALGLTTMEGGALPDHGPAILRLPAGHQGAAFLTFANFRAIEAYNPADAYVIAVGHLADRIGGAGPIAGPWPRGDGVLKGAERPELQRLLTEAEFDTQGADGRIGPRTQAAIQDWQTAHGLPADGYASPALLARLRGQ